LSTIFAHGGEVIGDVGVDSIELDGERVDAVLTNCGREYIHGVLWSDAAPRTFGRWLPTVSAFCNGFRCDSELEVIFKPRKMMPYWYAVNNLEEAYACYQPALWPGRGRWEGYQCVRQKVDSRHPWHILEDQDVVVQALKSWKLHGVDGADACRVHWRVGSRINGSVTVEHRTAYLQCMASLGVAPVGPLAAQLSMGAYGEICWFDEQYGIYRKLRQ